jgi:hypothetical protein
MVAVVSAKNLLLMEAKVDEYRTGSNGVNAARKINCVAPYVAGSCSYQSSRVRGSFVAPDESSFASSV